MEKPAVEKKGLSIQEACFYLGNISRPTLYRLMGKGEIRSYHIGSRRLLLKSDLDAFLALRVGEDENPT
jgi:excisionase family DNA binding protein